METSDSEWHTPEEFFTAGRQVVGEPIDRRTASDVRGAPETFTVERIANFDSLLHGYNVWGRSRDRRRSRERRRLFFVSWPPSTDAGSYKTPDRPAKSASAHKRYVTGMLSLEHPYHVSVRNLSPYALDRAIAAYLPASPAVLRKTLEEKLGGCADFSDVTTVSELLIFLAAADSGLPALPLVSAKEAKG